ncbi:synaptotagmin-like protein 5 [Argonauta hians]
MSRDLYGEMSRDLYGKRQKHGSNEDTRSEASNPSYVYDQHSESSSVHSTPDHRSNENKRRLDADPSLPSITISEAEGLARTHGESDGENHDFLMKGSSQSIRSGQSMSSSLGLTSSMGSRDSLSSYYSNAGEVNYGKINVTGDIQFGLDYDYKTSCLEIRVKQCHNLAPADTKKNRSDPYIKSYLLPDKTKTGKRKTKVKKNSLNPTFDETLRYNIAKSELENRTLWLTVWHNDRFGRNDFLGEVNIPFDYYRFEGPALKWYPLQQRQEYLPSSLSYKGELTLSLKFVTSEKLMTGSTTSLKHSRDGRSDVMDGGQLHVCVKEAKNLTAVRSGGYSDPFCKGYLLPEKNRTSKQKTPVVKKNCNPVWNHSFIFEDVSASMLADRCLELTLWDHDRISSNDFLGGVRLNLGSGICGRRYVDWMDAVGDEISLWQSMISRPNTWVDGTLILRANMNNRM